MRNLLMVDTFDIKGTRLSRMRLPREIFAAKINKILMAQAVRVYLQNQRQGTVSTKTRGEVLGSRRKIWRQKGTGRARHGDRYAPIFVGGGIAHGPKPRNFNFKMSKKMRRGALFSALTSKLKDKAIVVLEGLEKIKPKTKEMMRVMSKLKTPSLIGGSPQRRQSSKQKLKTKILLVLPNKIDNIIRAGRNIKNLDLQPVNLLNTYQILNHEVLIIMKEAIPVFKKTFVEKNG